MGEPESALFTIWGCRGSRPTPGPETLTYGGESTCYELMFGGDRLWIDAGTGLRRAAAQWKADGAPGEPRLLLSHLHLDHLIGLSSLAQTLSPESPATVYWAGDAAEAREALERLYSPPFWPLKMLDRGVFRFESLQLREDNAVGAFNVRPFPLNHPGDCRGFEIEAAGARVVIAADHEHGVPEIDREVERRARGADLLVYDASYSAEKHRGRVGWGHSTREEGLRLAASAGPGLTLLSHHESDADDEYLAAEEARLCEPGGDVRLARQGMRIALGGGRDAEIESRRAQ